MTRVEVIKRAETSRLQSLPADFIARDYVLGVIPADFPISCRLTQ